MVLGWSDKPSVPVDTLDQVRAAQLGRLKQEVEALSQAAVQAGLTSTAARAKDLSHQVAAAQAPPIGGKNPAAPRSRIQRRWGLQQQYAASKAKAAPSSTSTAPTPRVSLMPGPKKSCMGKGAKARGPPPKGRKIDPNTVPASPSLTPQRWPQQSQHSWKQPPDSSKSPTEARAMTAARSSKTPAAIASLRAICGTQPKSAAAPPREIALEDSNPAPRKRRRHGPMHHKREWGIDPADSSQPPQLGGMVREPKPSRPPAVADQAPYTGGQPPKGTPSGQPTRRREVGTSAGLLPDPVFVPKAEKGMPTGRISGPYRCVTWTFPDGSVTRERVMMKTEDIEQSISVAAEAEAKVLAEKQVHELTMAVTAAKLLKEQEELVRRRKDDNAAPTRRSPADHRRSPSRRRRSSRSTHGTHLAGSSRDLKSSRRSRSRSSPSRSRYSQDRRRKPPSRRSRSHSAAPRRRNSPQRRSRSPLESTRRQQQPSRSHGRRQKSPIRRSRSRRAASRRRNSPLRRSCCHGESPRRQQQARQRSRSRRSRSPAHHSRSCRDPPRRYQPKQRSQSRQDLARRQQPPSRATSRRGRPMQDPKGPCRHGPPSRAASAPFSRQQRGGGANAKQSETDKFFQNLPRGRGQDQHWPRVAGLPTPPPPKEPYRQGRQGEAAKADARARTPDVPVKPKGIRMPKAGVPVPPQSDPSPQPIRDDRTEKASTTSTSSSESDLPVQVVQPGQLIQ